MTLDQITLYIQQNVQYAPFIIFGLLLLAGLNLPVSEDIMLFISANLAAKYPDHTIVLFAGVFMGAYLSDIIAYSMGRFFGPMILSPPEQIHWEKRQQIKEKLQNHPLIGEILADLLIAAIIFLHELKIFIKHFLIKLFDQRRTEKIRHYMHKYGIIALIVGRFIPFGVRNGIFITCGVSKVSIPKFMGSDLVACTVSSVTFFSLYYHIGPSMIEYVKKFNIIIFSVFTIFIVAFIIYRKFKKKAVKNTTCNI